MNIADIADRLADAHGLTKTAARQIVGDVFDIVASGAAKGGEVALAGFGKFKVTDRPARAGRNPRTGKPMTIAASKKIAFTPAKGLKDKL